MNNTIENTDRLETTQALQLHKQLASVKIEDVRRDTVLDRCAPRKVQAKAARDLFKALGIKGVSVTAPNYSMAQAVHVRIPKRQDFIRDAAGRVDWDAEAVRGEASRANRSARELIEQILFVAFPSHRDRSETQVDYFDYCWSVD